MRGQKGFSLGFKRQVIEELLGGEIRPAQLCRRHNLSPSMLYHWKRQHIRGQFKPQAYRPNRPVLIGDGWREPSGPHRSYVL